MSKFACRRAPRRLMALERRTSTCDRRGSNMVIGAISGTVAVALQTVWTPHAAKLRRDHAVRRGIVGGDVRARHILERAAHGDATRQRVAPEQLDLRLGGKWRDD